MHTDTKHNIANVTIFKQISVQLKCGLFGKRRNMFAVMLHWCDSHCMKNNICWTSQVCCDTLTRSPILNTSVRAGADISRQLVHRLTSRLPLFSTFSVTELHCYLTGPKIILLGDRGTRVCIITWKWNDRKSTLQPLDRGFDLIPSPLRSRATHDSLAVILIMLLLLQPTMLKRTEAAICHLTHTLWLTHSARHRQAGRRWRYSVAVLLILQMLVMCCRRQHLCFHRTVLTRQAFIAGFQCL